ncbi:Ctf8-domain-containing protein [Bombardia bombarda]|uniref:Ctf8-domain-containing protein n=1 Tax=Bombardia bombarda TaxID=252184 RepID=A0AA39XJF4_9PEZI|nr:Ctf8-domain-containing protein [Bombardia bombarda]
MSSSTTTAPAEAPTIKLHPRPAAAASIDHTNDNLPKLLQTPAGLALLELQGTINVPEPDDDDVDMNGATSSSEEGVQVGQLIFPDYRPDSILGGESTAWMKRVYMYIGQHQRLMGEVKKLPKPLAVVRRREREGAEGKEGEEGEEDLEVVEIVKYKIVFSQRPEPVTGSKG